ncbi:hypothetical protein J6590_052349 [Homalodisca vitripennis]|nr:hypothetical protein J6590_052349 [Homalodisca vitripennis]
MCEIEKKTFAAGTIDKLRNSIFTDISGHAQNISLIVATPHRPVPTHRSGFTTLKHGESDNNRANYCRVPPLTVHRTRTGELTRRLYRRRTSCRGHNRSTRGKLQFAAPGVFLFIPRYDYAREDVLDSVLTCVCVSACVRKGTKTGVDLATRGSPICMECELKVDRRGELE